MSEPNTSMKVAWQRRLRYRLDDAFAAALSSAFKIRFRTFERTNDRVAGQLTLHVDGDLAFLAVEMDEFATPVMRLIGPARLEDRLRAEGRAFDVIVDRIEKEQRAEPGGLHGTPLWLAYPRTVGSAAIQLVIDDEGLRSRIVEWPAEVLTTEMAADASGAGLALIVSSLPEALARVKEAGGSQVTAILKRDVGDFVTAKDPSDLPLVLWQMPDSFPLFEEPTMIPARIDVASSELAAFANFYRHVAGWRSEVLHGSEPLTAFFALGDRRIGVISEHNGPASRAVSVFSPLPGPIVRAADNTPGFAVTSEPLRFPLGRRWVITDESGAAVSLAEEPADAPEPLTSRRSRLHLPPSLLIATTDLEAAFVLLERTLTEILLRIPAPPPDDQRSALRAVLNSALDPSTRRLIELLGSAADSALVIEALTDLRPFVRGLVEDLRLAVGSLEDHDLAVAYHDSRESLIRIGLLPEDTTPLRDIGVHV